MNAQLRRINTDLGSGRGQVGGAEQAIRTLGDARSVETLSKTMIGLPNGRFVRLSELGSITDTYEEPKSFSRFDGNPVVTFAVFRAKAPARSPWPKPWQRRWTRCGPPIRTCRSR